MRVPKQLRHLALGLLGFCLILQLGSAATPAIPSPIVADSALTQALPVTPASLDQGRQLYEAGRFADAVQVWQAMANYYEQAGDRAHQALSLSYVSLAYQRLNQWDLAQQAIAASRQTLQTATTPDAILWAQVLNTQANLQLHTGQTETALDTWQQAKTYYEQAGDSQGVLGIQLNQAQAWQSLGYYQRSRQILTAIVADLQAAADSFLKIQTLHSLGNVFRTSGDFTTSQQILREGLTLAETLKAVNEYSPILLSLGNVARDQGHLSDAIYYFEQAEQVATTPEVRLDARLNQLHIAAAQGELSQVVPLANHIREQLVQLPPSRATLYGAINLAHTLSTLNPQTPILPPRTLEQLLTDTVESARRLPDATAAAYALAQLGKFYAQQGQVARGIERLQNALQLGQTLQSDPIIAQAAWTLGRTLQANGQTTAAIAAYQDAIKSLQALRSDLVGINQDVQFSFRESVEPVYRELVSLILDSNPDQAALANARELIEALQLAELDDFFRDACLDTQPRQIDEIDPQAAVLYSILLRDRVAVIVSAAGQPLSHYSIPIPQTQAEQTIREFLAKLHPVSDNTAQRQISMQLYDWLIRPAEAAGALQGRETLVFVLDGILQRLPVAALYDGQHYLIEKYAVALSPGLKLLAAQALQPQGIQAVVGGISEARAGFAALPKVESEINDITQTVSAKSLLNAEFTRTNLATTLQEKSANVLHLATHGQFGSTQENTFLLTWDGRLSVRELAEILHNRENRRAHTLELLVLSACDTAVGDDRAVLGLAGFAVKSGARSTVASLWPVKDQVAAQMMTHFYAALRQGKLSKAEALRQSQRSLITDKSFSDPFYWASFVMVGNWL